MSEAEYKALPEKVARAIEIVHGHVIRRESPSPRHNRIARRLASALEHPVRLTLPFGDLVAG